MEFQRHKCPGRGSVGVKWTSPVQQFVESPTTVLPRPISSTICKMATVAARLETASNEFQKYQNGQCPPPSASPTSRSWPFSPARDDDQLACFPTPSLS